MKGCLFAMSLLLFFGGTVAARAQNPAETGPVVSPDASAQKIPNSWRQISIPPLPPFHPQQPHRVELSNGMIIFLQEDHELPTIDGYMEIRGGVREFPAEKAGLLSVYSHSWRTGGTVSKTGDEMDDYLESKAAKVETGYLNDATVLYWSCLKQDFDDVFRTANELLRQPAFREDKIALAKQQEDGRIERRNESIQLIARREAYRLAYGPDNPYARIPEYDTVAAITRQDLLDWHRRYVHPNNIILGIIGDFDPNTTEAALHKAFGDWPKGPAAPKTDVEFNKPKPGFYFIPKDDVTQSAIRMVYLGIQRDNPDMDALAVMDKIFFEESFSSRIVNDVRTRRGLAYSVGGGFNARYAPYDRPGIFTLEAGTKGRSTAETIQALYDELDGLDKHPATAEELAQAKDSILNSFIFEFDSKRKVLNQRMNFEFYHYPADFLDRFRNGIEGVTLADVARVARKYIHKQDLAVLVVGKASDFDRPLSSFGPVTTLNIMIPAREVGKSSTPVARHAPARNGEGANQTRTSREAKAYLEQGKAAYAKGWLAGLQGNSAISKDESARAVDALRKAIDLDPNLLEAHRTYILAVQAANRKDPKAVHVELEALYQQWASASPDSALYQ